MVKPKYFDNTDEKTAKGFRVAEVLEYAPSSVDQILKRIGFIPGIKVQLKKDSAIRILVTLEKLGYARFDEQTKNWSKGHKTL